MDNRRIDISAEGRADFDLAIKLGVHIKRCTGYRVGKEGLVLYWAESDKATKLPYEMDFKDIAEFAWGYLTKNPPAGKEPDHDGDNDKGFRIYNEAWGHVGGEWQAFIAIQSIWAMYGK